MIQNTKKSARPLFRPDFPLLLRLSEKILSAPPLANIPLEWRKERRLILQGLGEELREGALANLAQGHKAFALDAGALALQGADLKALLFYLANRGFEKICLQNAHLISNFSELLATLSNELPEVSCVFAVSSFYEVKTPNNFAVKKIFWPSFRELFYPEMEKIPLMEIANQRVLLGNFWSGKRKILGDFENYFAKRGERDEKIFKEALEREWPATEKVARATVEKALLALNWFSLERPRQNLSELFRYLNCDRNLGLKILKAMVRGGLLNQTEGKKGRYYLSSAALSMRLHSNFSHQLWRESFFADEILKAKISLSEEDNALFLVDKNYLFYLGDGEAPPGTLAVSEFLGSSTKTGIPLWLFGFLN